MKTATVTRSAADERLQYPFLSTLEAEWTVVLHELNGILESTAGNGFQAWHETGLYQGQWDVFGLYAFGKKLESNCVRAPRTTALVECIPGLVTAGFSALSPGTVIKPHVGYSGEVLRCHLGLIAPSTAADCGLRVGATVHHWLPGQAFVFDDTVEHEAWNHGDRTRYILLMDFKK